MTREQQRKACEEARAAMLQEELLKLATWAKYRSLEPIGNHRSDTTLTLLERHAMDIRRAVNRAGMQAISDIDTETWP